MGSGATVNHTYAAAGSYTAIVTATNSAGSVSASTPVTLTDVPISGLNASNDSPTPVGNATAFTATISAGTGVTYQWNFGDGTALGSGATATATHTYAAAGNYTAIVTATNSLGSVSASTPVTITQAGFKLYLPLITRNASPSALAPQGGSAPTTTGRPVPSRVARPVDPFPKV